MNFLSRNPVGGATSEDKYDGECSFDTLIKHEEMNAKKGSLFVSQSKRGKHTTEDKMNTSDENHENKATNHNQLEHSRTKIT